MTDLRKLSEAATPGEWCAQDFTGARAPGQGPATAVDIIISCSWADTIAVADMGGGYMGYQGVEQARADAALIVALVNEFRSGSLIPRSEYEHLQALLVEAREAGSKVLTRGETLEMRKARARLRNVLSRIDDALAAEPEARG